MQQSNEVRIEWKESYVRLFPRGEGVAVLRDLEIPSGIPSRPHIYKWMSVCRKMLCDSVPEAVIPYFPFGSVQMGVKEMKAKPCNDNQCRSTKEKRNQDIAHEPVRKTPRSETAWLYHFGNCSNQ